MAYSLRKHLPERGLEDKKEEVKEAGSSKSAKDGNQGQGVTWKCWREYLRRKKWLTVSNAAGRFEKTGVGGKPQDLMF